MWLSARDVYEMVVGNGYNISLESISVTLHNLAKVGGIQRKMDKKRVMYLVD